ncbi:uncharacterized protein LOC120430077 [Culex pipiens pallens]|uniref:uncharacterized protein LOC120430077 n=1 Tax=Culex pipiens pallens TaxID=42434 RepID=UPI00195443AA|nr:uncharacterized protein LOC120430077 [Culex pipiens pallens]
MAENVKKKVLRRRFAFKFVLNFLQNIIGRDSRAVWIPDKGKALEMAPTGLHNFDGSCKLLLELVFEPDRSGKRPNETMVPGLHNIGGPCRLLPEVVDRIVRTRTSGQKIQGSAFRRYRLSEQCTT